jgi:4-amino-4-deoxy-L-arabinose transferase-like glycosyltransferase
MRVDMTESRPTYKPLLDLALLTLVIAALFSLSLGQRPYSAPSEARYVEIGREMAASGDYVTPRLNYVKYFEKPPLFYWVQAIQTKLFGVGQFASRWPTAKFSLLLCLITYGLGYTLYGRKAGVLSALTLASTLYVFALSRVVLVDVPVSVFIAATLTAFIYAVDAPDGRKRTAALYSMYAAAACAVLTKGLIGAVLPGIIVFLWLAMTGRWNLLKTIKLPAGSALFLLIAVPWHVLVAMRNPEFLHFYFIHEHFERYLTKVHGRYQPDWFFIVVLVAGLFPWIVFAPQALTLGLKGFWQQRKTDGKPLFLVIWMAFIFVFFSLSDSKLIPYILPIFPALAVLIGQYLTKAWDEKPVPGYALGLCAMILLLLLLALVPSLLLQQLDPASKVLQAIKQGGDEVSYLSFASMVMAALLVIAIAQGQRRHVIVTLFVISVIVLEMGDQIAGHYSKDSLQKIAGIIQHESQPGDEVASYEMYPQDLPVYLGRRITIAGWKGELEFGSTHEDTSAWMLDTPTFWKRWMKNDHLMFVVMREDTFKRLIEKTKPEDLHLYAGTQDERTILFMNRPYDRSKAQKLPDPQHPERPVKP